MVYERIERFLRPDNPSIAILERGKGITYRELHSQRAKLAHSLRHMDGGAPRSLGILNGRGTESVIAILGALSAGIHYVPLNPEFPAKKLWEIIQDAEIEYVAVSPASLAVLERLLADRPPGNCLKGAILIDHWAPAAPPVFDGMDCRSLSRLESPSVGTPVSLEFQDPDNLAYVMYTSGTTGKSKGVMVTRANVDAFAAWALSTFKFGPDDRFSSHSNINFDLSVFDIFCSLASGAVLCPLSSIKEILLPGRFINESGITVWLSVPGVLNQFVKSGHMNPGSFHPKLRYLLFCGEELPLDLAMRCLAAAPSAEVHNLYGPTEATVSCTAYRVTPETSRFKTVPIGIPNQPGGMAVLKPDGSVPAEVNEIGRLIALGPQVAAGYWKNPELTAKKFSSYPGAGSSGVKGYDTGDLAYIDREGLIFWCGRSDFQVKIKGYRVEIGEIESTILSNGHVEDVCVTVTSSGEGGIVAFYTTSEPDIAGTEEGILKHCADGLPFYMVPKKLVRVDAIQKNSNGKIDRVHYSALANAEYGESPAALRG